MPLPYVPSILLCCAPVRVVFRGSGRGAQQQFQVGGGPRAFVGMQLANFLVLRVVCGRVRVGRVVTETRLLRQPHLCCDGALCALCMSRASPGSSVTPICLHCASVPLVPAAFSTGPPPL